MKRLLITALVLCAVAAAQADDEFFDERYIQIGAGVAMFPTKTCVVLTEYDYREIPSYEFLDHQVLGISFKILFPIREWVKLGAQVNYAVLDYPYDDPGKMSSEFDLHVMATLLSLQMPFSLYYNDWLDLMLIPQLFYYGAGQEPQNMVPGLEGYNELVTRTSIEWEGVGIGGSLAADVYFGDLFLHLEGGWLQGGVDVERMLWKAETDTEPAVYLDPSSEMGNVFFSAGVGYFL
ncbi:MAG: hypothetical protein A2Y64_09345 [Candidatus Coatesbacteria bacterium RBG_13_66_14]|uniref:Outer membrane protein beta-barrel domain-containing protein n=1 Tax=Candidatus Coatesbacteria bacterium RBG_13_66_14 TaxID=1817816 RepID=A0A1F5EXV8_9BACT|nr:MAG: hypothetical protein A2Y64_09345 [Candidatus Coatesbacteria bacterium RBG_13_66_14]